MLEEHLVPFVHALKTQLYARGVIEAAQILARELILFLSGSGRRRPGILPRDVRSFVGVKERIFEVIWRRPMGKGSRERLHVALNLFLRYLASRGVAVPVKIRGPAIPPAAPGYEDTLRDFERFLLDHRGLKPRAVRTYVDHANRLCQMLACSKLCSWEDFTSRQLYDHLMSEARRMGHLGFQAKSTALRAFFRFLTLTGRSKRDLASWLVRYRRYRLGHVPRTIEPDALYRLFEDMKAGRACDLRDRAAFLLLALYGLRIREVTRLRLEDVRWSEGRIVLRARKAGKDLSLPLHPAVARVLREYIDLVRPAGSSAREVFLTRHGGRPYPESNLGMTLRYRLKKLGLAGRLHGFRHALATRLLNNGCPPEWIQQLLGHAHPESTRIYSKADLVRLREVADVELPI